MTERKEGRVLVVDDEPMVRETLGRLLGDEGYVVDVADDGTTALACVRAAAPDAILLDLMMPGMNGRQFLQALRAEPAHAVIPVLLMTAVHGMSVNLATLGASEVVEKPFDVDDLLNKVALAVYRSREASGGPPLPGPVTTPAGTIPPPIAIPRTITPERDRGIVLVVEHDRARLQRLDVQLSARGFTVVSMTRALVQLARLARALQPHAILVDFASEGAAGVVEELGELAAARPPLLVYARDRPPAAAVHGAPLLGATDAQLVDFVERQPRQPR
nr:response regulator [Kofleriaceae bacterium]